MNTGRTIRIIQVPEPKRPERQLPAPKQPKEMPIPVPNWPVKQPERVPEKVGAE